MSPEAQEYLMYIAFFVCGFAAGYGFERAKHDREVAEWKAIAHKAQHLNSLANTLEQERSADAQRHTLN